MIRAVELYKSFGPSRVLNGLNLEVRKGESMVVIGGSGSGKSVLIKHIIGILKPDSGEVYVDDVNMGELNERELTRIRRKFGMLFQGAALFDSLKVWQNVGFALLRDRRYREDEVREIASEKLRTVGLPGIEDLMPAELSGGMKKRVGLARAIAHEPEIILYDEPTTGLDPIMADAINDMIVKLSKKLSVTSVTITHDMQSAYKIADRISMLYNGRIIDTGTPDEIKNTKNPIVKQFTTGSASGPIKIEGVTA
jgi:phospholipid/cholesterol/gamma-HCH transport system ATP-binding protein